MKMLKTLNFILAILFAPVLCTAQTSNFSISAKIGTIGKPSKAYLDYMDNGVAHEDSIEVVGGNFNFTGSINGIVSARMALDHQGLGKQQAIYQGDVIYFYFGKENFSINSGDSLQNASIKGSTVNQAYQSYNEQIGGTMMSLTKAVNQEFQRLSVKEQADTNIIKQIDQKFRTAISARAEKQLQFATSNPHSFFALIALSEGAGTKVNAERVQPIFDKLDAHLRATDIGKELQQRIAASSKTAIGSVAPAFTQNDIFGKPLSLETLRGKIVLIDFWASWCSPCRAENPNLAKAYELYKNKGFEIISVSLDNSRENWLQAIEADKMSWKHVSDLRGWNNQVGRLYGIRAVPESFLLDRNGVIVASGLRGNSLDSKLSELFK